MRLLLAIALVGCAGPASAPPPATASSVSHGARAAREAHLFGLTEAAIPELTPIWPALSARTATEVIESLRVEEDAALHCLQVLVAGDLAEEALEAWREGARGFECEGDERAQDCRRDRTTLRIVSEGDAEEGDAAALDALAAEMGVPEEPSATASACVSGLSPSRLARIDERLHVAGLLEPWHGLHERLGARRFKALRWTRSERGDELSVRYRADDEAYELAAEWAREAGLAGGEGGSWRRLGAPLSLGLELHSFADSVEIELLLARDP